MGAVQSGPLGANGVPAAVPGPNGQLIPLNPLKEIAFNALGGAYSISYLIAGSCAIVAAILAVAVLRGQPDDALISKESLE